MDNTSPPRGTPARLPPLKSEGHEENASISNLSTAAPYSLPPPRTADSEADADGVRPNSGGSPQRSLFQQEHHATVATAMRYGVKTKRRADRKHKILDIEDAPLTNVNAGANLSQQEQSRRELIETQANSQFDRIEIQFEEDYSNLPREAKIILKKSAAEIEHEQALLNGDVAEMVDESGRPKSASRSTKQAPVVALPTLQEMRECESWERYRLERDEEAMREKLFRWRSEGHSAIVLELRRRLMPVDDLPDSPHARRVMEARYYAYYGDAVINADVAAFDTTDTLEARARRVRLGLGMPSSTLYAMQRCEGTHSRIADSIGIDEEKEWAALMQQESRSRAIRSDSDAAANALQGALRRRLAAQDVGSRREARAKSGNDDVPKEP